jgi:hypothetical protein
LTSPATFTARSLPGAALAAALAALTCGTASEQSGRTSLSFTGDLAAGDRFERRFGPGLTFVLAPTPEGWEIQVLAAGRDENLARLSPPLRGPLNPRFIEGWQLRNADNSGPNQPGDLNVNAPGPEREIVFSPEVGAAVDGPGAGRPPTPAEVEKVGRWGRGSVTILDCELAGLGQGQTPRAVHLRFSATLSWPAEAR